MKNRGQFIRLSDEEFREIHSTATKLGLPASEITRRSLRIALPILRDLNLPGSPRNVSKPEVVTEVQK